MKEQLEKIKQEALAALAETQDAAELDSLRVKYLGKKGELTAVLKQMGKLSAEERPVIGQMANDVRELITAELEARTAKIEEIAEFAPNFNIGSLNLGLTPSFNPANKLYLLLLLVPALTFVVQ